ncbi:MAG: MarR family transcriptional regulator [Dehalococcoidales bacterium]|nr:MarR family transcriptional regulator [Dehalococcoidales bacterium]
MLDRSKRIQELLDSLHVIKRTLLTQLASYSKGTDLSVAQLLVLRIVGEHEGTSLKEIANLMGLTSSAITQVVNVLVEKGYLIREENPIDRRALKLSLSHRGAGQLQALQRRVVETLLDVFDDKELIAYCELSKKILAKVSNSAKARE